MMVRKDDAGDCAVRRQRDFKRVLFARLRVERPAAYVIHVTTTWSLPQE
jgi:hypothetical protein